MNKLFFFPSKPIHNALKTAGIAVFFAFPIFFAYFFLKAEVQEIPPITFGGGVDYKTDCSDIRDDRACDSNNMISDYLGTASKRFGSRKYIDQAISSVAVKGLYRAYYSTGSTIYKATIMINNGTIYADTTTTATGHVWKSKKTGLDKNQNYEFRQHANHVLIAGDSLNDAIMRYDIQTDSVTENFTNDGGINSAFVTFKHHIVSKNYYIGANVKDLKSGTTYYPPRVHYSLLIDTPTSLNFTSMTILRWFDVPNNGEEITGIGEIGDVHIFSPSSISQLSFDVLNVGSQGGDQSMSKVVHGFGCIAPRTLVNTGKAYIFLSKDGIRYYDPTVRNTLGDETKLISTNIEPIIKRVLENGTFKNAYAFYYGKRNWYIFSYEDPYKYPKGKSNSTLILDLNTGEWFPFSNWLPECYAEFNNIEDKQELIYGDTNDGYVYYVDQEKFQNDSRKEIVIDNCDLPDRWINAGASTHTVIEGTSSIKLSMISPNFHSSITLMTTINLGEWYDKSKTTTNDKISFKVYPSSLCNMTSMRVDLELDLRSDTFDLSFTSITISSNALTNGTSEWTTVEIALSSFPILDSWISVSSGTLPFAETPTYYGLRFFSTGIAWHELTIDDIRFVMDKECPLNAFRLSKSFNLSTNAEKRWRQLFVDCDKPATSKFYIDYYSDFGDFFGRETVSNSFDNDIFVTGYNGVEGIMRLDSNDFTVLDSTLAGSASVFAPRPMTADEENIYVGDQYNHKIMKFDRSDLTVLISSAGSYGTNGNNFNIPFQMALNKTGDNKTLFICDFANHAVKIYNANTMKFKKTFGTLGNGATSFYCPSGIAADDIDLFIAQDANHRLQKWGISSSSLSYKDSVLLNLNTAGNTKLAIDQKYIYVYYSKVAENNFQNTELWLEQRNKSDLKLVSKSMILPENVTIVNSTYSVMGDIGISDFIYLTFTDDPHGNGTYYLQKRLKDGVNFPIVKEISSSNSLFSVASNGLNYKTKRQLVVKDIGGDGSRYIQYKISEDSLDNSFKLYKLSPLLKAEPVRERY